MTDCPESVRVSNSSLDKGGLLICFLEAGHDGLHYDEHDKISWKAAEPDA